MRRLLLSLALFLTYSALAQAQSLSPTGPPYNPTCNTWFQSSYTATASAPIITGLAGKAVYICGWHVTTGNSTAQTTFQLSQGTTSLNAVVMTPQLNVNYTAPSTDHIDYAILQTSLFAVATTPNNLYLAVGGAGNAQIIIYYGQY